MGKRFLRTITVWAVVFCLSFTQIVFAQEASQDQDTTQKNLDYLRAIMDLVKEKYGGEVTEEQLIEGAVRGIFNSMDPYTTYYNKEEADSFMGEINGEYDGIGISMEKKGDFIEVTDVFKGSPAEKAGVYAGDKIAAIDGVNIAGATLEEAGGLIKGLSDTIVTLGIVRGTGKEIRNIEVIRGKVSVNPVVYSIKDGVGYIRLDIFNANSSGYMLLALNEMDNKGVNKIVLDLRNNPGGDVSQAIAIARKFVPKGLITKLDFKSESISDQEYYSYLAEPKYKLAVLVNDMSASASEILAGAIQDTEAGTLIGTKTFGKAKVQSIIPVLTPEAYKKYSELLGIDIVDAYDLIYVYGIIPEEDEIAGYTKITTGLYTTPKGRMIDLQGLTPDIRIDDPSSAGTMDINSIKKLGKVKKPGLNGESSEVYNAEKILKALGYDIEAPDSKLDRKTFEAIRKFQKSKNGCAYGVLDFTTQQWLNDELDKLILKTDRQYAKAVEVLSK